AVLEVLEGDVHERIQLVVRDLLEPVLQPRGLGARLLLTDPLRRECAGTLRVLNAALGGGPDTGDRPDRAELDNPLEDVTNVLDRREEAAGRVVREDQLLPLLRGQALLPLGALEPSAAPLQECSLLLGRLSLLLLLAAAWLSLGHTLDLDLEL